MAEVGNDLSPTGNGDHVEPAAAGFENQAASLFFFRKNNGLDGLLLRINR